MGGIGSRRYYRSGKGTTSSYRRLDIRFLQRRGFLVPGRRSDVSWSPNGEPSGNITVSVWNGLPPPHLPSPSKLRARVAR
jgi:hypothetical protein